MNLKGVVRRGLTAPGVSALFAPLLSGRASVMMLHRFRDDEHGVAGTDPAQLGQVLAWLRRSGYELLSLEALFARLDGHGPPLHRAVAFTLDDGYYDQAAIAAPVFAHYDCPSTTFVTTGFLDGALWMWWDRVDYVFGHTHRRALYARAGSAELRLSWSDDDGRQRARDAFVDRCLAATDADKHAAIAALAEAADVELPDVPPAHCRPMSWTELRAAERSGMRFAPHTVTHPLLARTPDRQSRWEIEESWRRVRAEVRTPVPVFAYPNGQLADFGPREVKTLNELGFIGAFSGVWGYADRQVVQADPHARFRVRRFSYPPDLVSFVQIVSGLERVNLFMRGMRTA